jgi:hypothetical protein
MMGGKQVNSRAYLSRFNFGGGTKQESFHAFWWRTQPFALAMTLKEEGNVFLDEPTNDLDINTLRALEEGLESFAGCGGYFTTDGFRQNLYILALKVTLKCIVLKVDSLNTRK